MKAHAIEGRTDVKATAQLTGERVGVTHFNIPVNTARLEDGRVIRRGEGREDWTAKFGRYFPALPIYRGEDGSAFVLIS